MRNIDSWWEPGIKHRKLSSVLCDDRDGWDGGLRGREAQGVRVICVHRADSLCDTTGTDMAL